MREEPLEPLAFVHEMTAAIGKHTKREEIDLNSVILMGWSEAQTNPDVKALVTHFQTRYRDVLTGVVRKWQARRYVPAETAPEDVAKALLSLFLGTIVQEALLGEADPATLTRGVEGLLGAGVSQDSSNR